MRGARPKGESIVSEDSGKPDVIEAALLELKAAEAAGVFARTGVDGRRILAVDPEPADDTQSTRWSAPRTVGRWLPIAAAVALAIGVWSWMFSAEVGTVHGRNFQKCFGGPTASALAECNQHDYDADGDVDLVDFRAFQLAFASGTP
jgi:hypothetical protein